MKSHILTIEQRQEAVTIGKNWGEQEAESWLDQHFGVMNKAPDWTMGTYCGGRPDGLNDEQWNEFERIVDYNAKKVWDSYKDTI